MRDDTNRLFGKGGGPRGVTPSDHFGRVTIMERDRFSEGPALAGESPRLINSTSCLSGAGSSWNGSSSDWARS
jgi:hypothetical protein